MRLWAEKIQHFHVLKCMFVDVWSKCWVLMFLIRSILAFTYIITNNWDKNNSLYLNRLETVHSITHASWKRNLVFHVTIAESINTFRMWKTADQQVKVFYLSVQVLIHTSPWWSIIRNLLHVSQAECVMEKLMYQATITYSWPINHVQSTSV